MQIVELQEQRAAKRARHRGDSLPDSDEYEDADHPIIDMMEGLGRDSVLTLCNFIVAELSRLWSRISGYMSTRWNVGRGNKHPESGMGILFMILCVPKNGGSWDLMASTYRVKAPTFEKKIVSF
ncbi:hypothetical protein PHMEG_00019406 [Phytophthora megakarya]|uniref:Uncharacterized protein n=1 Tax=Phytophthora megakarya TaxID=4795 RepID=A0A225VT58_9STRA|nr:hypothetical protein PHMEG_00019406 [Phytophthora megakarya]